MTKRKQSVGSSPEITPVLPIAGQKYPPYFEVYLEFFAVFQNFCLLVTRFVAKFLMTSRVSLFTKHWISQRHKVPHGRPQILYICDNLDSCSGDHDDNFSGMQRHVV
jgi:hypothetical protein